MTIAFYCDVCQMRVSDCKCAEHNKLTCQCNACVGFRKKYDEAFVDPLISPWQPMRKAIDLKHIGKLQEELGELSAALARVLIQGIDECEPVTNKSNRVWLEEEIADVYANLLLVIYHFKLNSVNIQLRAIEKQERLQKWHGMLAEDGGK